MANVSQLQPALTPHVQTNSSKAPEKDADFLALRLLNKRARLRLSSEPFDLAPFPAKVNLFAIVNSKGWFAAVTRDASGASAFILSPLTDLRSAFTTASAEDEQAFRPRRRVPINGAPPHIIVFACNDSRLLLGLLDGSIHVYASDQLFSGGEDLVQPIHAFTSSSAPLLSIQPNPGDIPELVAVLRDCAHSPGSLAVELLDVQRLVSSGGWVDGKSPSTTPTSISWSPKGKQLALGLQSGDIVTFNPTATASPKSSIPHPPAASNMGVISIHWLSASSFHTIYAPPGPLKPEVEQSHVLVCLDSKSNSAQDVKFNSPYLPFPGLRPPGDFLVCLRGWNPSKLLLFVGDSTSSDIGLIGSVADDSGESWCNFSLEETSTPSLPLDRDLNDTILLGMDVDLTSDELYHHSTASGEPLELPAHPIMYVYASDGTVQGWHVLNVTGVPYPGMVTPLGTAMSAPSVLSVPSGMVRELSSDMQTTPAISPATSSPTEASTVTPTPSLFVQPATSDTSNSPFGTPAPTFGQSTFGQSAFGQQSVSAFSKAPSFGQSSTFGSTSTASAFGQPSTSAFGTGATTGGFGAFSSTGPAKFGQPAFSFGGSSQVTTTISPSISAPEESMAADDAPSFGGLGLGSASSQDADSKPSIFGKPSVPSSSGQQSTDSGMIKPGTGFGAFSSGFDQKSPFARPSSFSTTQQPGTVFGTSAFQSKPESIPSTAFGASPSFGSGQSAFGQPAFGQSSFGQFQSGTSAFGKLSFGAASSVTPPTTSSASTSVGGFSAFASGTQSAFGAAASKNASAKPAWTTSDSSKQLEVTDAFAKPSQSAQSKTPSTNTPRTASLPSTPSPFAARDSIVRDEDDDSRPSSPARVQQKETISPFASSTAGTFIGAFGNLQTTPSAFIKPASGSFGELPKDSPFFGSKPPASVFSLSATPGTPTSMPQKPSSAQPMFGASSMPDGGFKSAFAPVVTTPSQPPPVSSSNAFSAFLSGSGGFAAFSSGGNKSFGDLLRSSEETKQSGVLPPDATPKRPDQAPVVSTTPASTPTSMHAHSPPKTPSTPPATPKPDKEQPRTNDVKVNEVPVASKEQAYEVIPAQEASLESISSSTSSSFVKVEREEGEIGEKEAPGEAELQDEAESFLSDVPSESEEEEEDDDDDEEEDDDDDDDEEEEEEEEEEREERVQKEVDPTEIPLPITPASTRSPSTTPKAEHPKIRVSVSPPPSQTPSPPVAPRVSPVRDLSTTPPGSPVKDAPPTPGQPQTPPLKASPQTPPFGLVPRPNNNRPIRSSPLASTPFVPEGEAEKAPLVSKSEPPVLPQPAAPKSPFGQLPLTPPPVTKLAEDDSVRPKTPPLLSTYLAPGDKSAFPPTSSIFTPAATRASVPSSFTPTDKVTTTPATPTTTPGLSFMLPTSLPACTPSSATPSAWGMPPKFAEATTTTAKAALPLFGGGQFGARAGTAMPLPSSSFASLTPTPSPGPTPVPLIKAPSPAPTLEQGMQSECAVLLSKLTKELKELEERAMAASAKMVEFKKPSGVVHQKMDLGDPSKWAVGDIKEYGQILVSVQEDVKELKLHRVSLRKALKELDSNVLKVNTRKEEIARFSKARTDAEFAKMLKIRTLAPEYSETQSQLRKNIRMIKDRVQKLEDHLQASKKRINELKTGRPSIRPPSLDTVNRTFRNIDVVIDQQKQEISLLRYRIGKLDISGSTTAREQLAVSPSKRPLNVTLNVAVTTAATLNAERSAQRLKKALLASRSRPLLNTTATASPIPTSFQTPQKASVAQPDEKEKITESSFSLPTTPTVMMSFPTSLPSWAPQSSEFGGASPTMHDISPSRSRGGGKHHQKPIVLKKHVSAAGDASGTMLPPPLPPLSSLTPAPATLFEWNSVELVRPVSSLPFALRPAGST